MAVYNSENRSSAEVSGSSPQSNKDQFSWYSIFFFPSEFVTYPYIQRHDMTYITDVVSRNKERNKP
jgi:hypothetical protein